MTKTISCFLAAWLLLPISSAQTQQDPDMAPCLAQQTGAHHNRYRLIQVGTFGGPNSLYQGAALIATDSGMVVGAANTPNADPNAPVCFDFSCFIQHGWKWQDGVLTDLDVLPGGNSSCTDAINSRGLVVGQSEDVFWSGGFDTVWLNCRKPVRTEAGSFRTIGPRRPLAELVPNATSTQLSFHLLAVCEKARTSLAVQTESRSNPRPVMRTDASDNSGNRKMDEIVHSAVFRKAAQDAWRATLDGTARYETGFYINERGLPGPQQSSKFADNGINHIKLAFRSDALATFHIHNNYGNPTPSALDINIAKRTHTMVYVGSRDGLYSVDPNGIVRHLFSDLDWFDKI
jgi:hypothetical protein